MSPYLYLRQLMAFYVETIAVSKEWKVVCTNLTESVCKQDECGKWE